MQKVLFLYFLPFIFYNKWQVNETDVHFIPNIKITSDKCKFEKLKEQRRARKKEIKREKRKEGYVRVKTYWEFASNTRVKRRDRRNIMRDAWSRWDGNMMFVIKE